MGYLIAQTGIGTEHYHRGMKLMNEERTQCRSGSPPSLWKIMPPGSQQPVRIEWPDPRKRLEKWIDRSKGNRNYALRIIRNSSADRAAAALAEMERKEEDNDFDGINDMNAYIISLLRGIPLESPSERTIGTGVDWDSLPTETQRPLEPEVISDPYANA